MNRPSLILGALLFWSAGVATAETDWEAEFVTILFEDCASVSDEACFDLLLAWFEKYESRIQPAMSDAATTSVSQVTSSGTLPPPPPIEPLSSPSADGTAWLMANQNGSGSWGDPWFATFRPTNELRDTTTVIEALESAGPERTAALAWLDTQSHESFDHLARATKAKAGAGEDVTADVSALLAGRNAAISSASLPNFPGGGWGAAEGFESDAIDTAIVLDALVAAGQTTGLGEAVAFLLACQNPDGGFGLRPGEESGLMVSMKSLLALSHFPGLSGVTAALEAGAEYVVVHQAASGLIGESAGAETAWETALGKLVLEAAGRSTEEALAEEALLASQSPDGSWNGDPYRTGLAVIALPEPSWNLQIACGIAGLALCRLHRRASRSR